MTSDLWPFFSLRITTPRLELRYPNDDVLLALARALPEGIHDPATMPFSEPWTRAESPDLEHNALKFWWSRRASLSPENWSLSFAVFDDDDVVGIQDLMGRQFTITRAVLTGSWLLQRAQGRGIGKEMRAAVLHLAFEGLGAVEAYTNAFEDNPASLGVTRALGYEPNGSTLHTREGAPARSLEYVMTRERWHERRRDDIEIHGLDACLPLLGLAERRTDQR